jgi:hypothetical protein
MSSSRINSIPASPGALAPQPSSDRVAASWEADAWVGALRRAFGPTSEVLDDGRGGMLVENHPPHTIIALWRPKKGQEPFLRRWPSIVTLSRANEEALLDEVLSLIPDGARLWISRGDIDWALMAEIVMISERNLEPFQYRELEKFVSEDRARTLAAIGRGYTGDARRYTAFVDTVREDHA